MKHTISNHMRSRLLLAAYTLGTLALTIVGIDLLIRLWRFLRISVDVCILLAGDQIKLFINH